MRRPAVRYALAFLITIASAVWQRISGPTYPVRGHVTLGGQEIRLELTRTHAGEGDQPVSVVAPDGAITGQVAWRRFPSETAWSFLPMVRRGDTLEAALPHQPPAGKLEYQLRLDRGAESRLFPPRPAVTRFKGNVSTPLLVTHVAVMFSGMLVSSAAGLAALVPGLPLRKRTLITLGLILLGGFLLGPMVQKAAFGAWWTGIPFGWDLTDNKTLFAALFWAAAAILQRRGGEQRTAVILAALATLVVFAIPHSTWGSEIRWETPAKPG
ncbi:MAG TPA: hypothetical protein VL084_13670 [Thermoanaerobaculia bacterium]|nr:hypothetical protein [Thermoanaerobaculia bacterium]